MQPLRILIADDNKDAAETLAFLLKMAGYETRIAHDGEAACRIAGQFEPHVFILDLGMPSLDGFETAKRLRADPRFVDAMLAAFSGYGDQESVRRAREAGFDRHFLKGAANSEILTYLEDATTRLAALS